VEDAVTISVDQLGLDLGARLGPLLRRAYLLLLPAAYDDATTALGLELAFDLANPRVQEILEELAERVVEIAETTREEIRALVGKAAEEGWSNEELARRLTELGEIRSRARARLIARTESASGYARAQLAAYRDSGVVRGTEWLLGPDPCEVCRPLGGRTVELDGEYAPGVRHPPAHPLCTCDIVATLR
jgi:hypothetical protein